MQYTLAYVEPDDALRAANVRRFESAGYDVQAYADNQAAFEGISRMQEGNKKPALLANLVTVKMGGLELMQALSGIGITPPAIMLMAPPMDNAPTKLQFASVGVDKLVMNGLRFEVLEAAIRIAIMNYENRAAQTPVQHAQSHTGILQGI